VAVESVPNQGEAKKYVLCMVDFERTGCGESDWIGWVSKLPKTRR